jgi:L,D-peptidoglycan transpeptidase YkuD (ErfK/YbiS/YcfS/YnhG family)
MEIVVERGKTKTTGVLKWGRRRMTCALGRAGIKKAKHEGDGVTPVGGFALRRLFYRADRRPAPQTALPVTAITPAMGWCDDPASPAYNRLVRLPCPWGHEVMTRADALYDLVVVLGHNDAPPIPGAGSAIFLHVAADGYAPTEGCVALAVADLVDLLAAAGPGDVLTVKG